MGAIAGSSAEPPEAVAELYAELRRLAQGHLTGREPLTLQATALVNETYLRLRDRYEWQGRAAFLSLASRAMRHILVDHSRKKHAEKRSATREEMPIDGVVERYDARSNGLLELDVALERLGACPCNRHLPWKVRGSEATLV